MALALALASLVPIGSNVPVAWLGLAIAATAAFALRLLLDLANPLPPPVRRGLVLPTAILLAVGGWAAAQLHGPAPAAWHHPAWSWVDGEGAIAVDPTAGRHFLSRLLAYAMLFALVLRAALDERRARRFVRVVAAWTGAVALYAIVAFVAGTNPITGAMADVATGPLVNRNHYATYAGIGMLASVAALVLGMERATSAGGPRHQRLRAALNGAVAGGWLFGLCALVNVGALTLTQSRGGAVAAVAGLVTFLVLLRRGGASGRAGVALLGVAIAVLVAASAGLGSTVARFVSSDVAGSRDEVYRAVVGAILERPLLGVGLGGFTDAFRAHVPASADVGVWDAAHNSYLENIMELGLPAAVALYGALALLLMRLWKGAGERRSTVLPAFALGVGVLAGIHSWVDFSLQIPAVASLFAVVLAIGHAQSHGHRDRIGGCPQ